MIKPRNVLQFDNDDEFDQYCIIPKLVKKSYVNKAGNNSEYMDFDFTPEYIDSVNNNDAFIIKDRQSNTLRRNCVSYRTIAKKVKNLYPWYYEKIFNKNKKVKTI